MKNQPFIEACRNFRFLNTPETLRYFYHPDHIGSTSWVTDSAKNGIQYCEYLPFGEPFLDQRSTTWNSRYTFSGKERDNETGYSYFGARYYNSDISIWLSVDPMADKYPNLTPYAYCANNPIVLVDPDGRTVVIDGEQAEVAYNSLQEGTNLKLKRNENGKLSASGDPLNDNDKMLLDAINSESVTVNIDVSTRYQGAGEYHGTTYDAESNTANSINGVNIYKLISLEMNGAAGSGMMHEVTEGYQMGLISIENKSDIARAGWKSEKITISAGNMQRSVITQKYENPHDYGLYKVGHARATAAPNEMSRKEARNYKASQERYTFPRINKSMEMFYSKLFRGL